MMERAEEHCGAMYPLGEEFSYSEDRNLGFLVVGIDTRARDVTKKMLRFLHDVDGAAVIPMESRLDDIALGRMYSKDAAKTDRGTSDARIPKPTSAAVERAISGAFGDKSTTREEKESQRGHLISLFYLCAWIKGQERVARERYFGKGTSRHELRERLRFFVDALQEDEELALNPPANLLTLSPSDDSEVEDDYNEIQELQEGLDKAKNDLAVQALVVSVYERRLNDAKNAFARRRALNA